MIYAPAPMWLVDTVLIVGIIILAAVALGSVVGALARLVRRRDLEALAVQAADHGEPSRVEVENDEPHYITSTPDGDGWLYECSRCGYSGWEMPPLPCEGPALDALAQAEAWRAFTDHCRGAFEHVMGLDWTAWEHEMEARR